MNIIEKIKLHKGIKAIHVVPFTNEFRKVIGWQNVAVCKDGVRFGLSLEDEDLLMDPNDKIDK